MPSKNFKSQVLYFRFQQEKLQSMMIRIHKSTSNYRLKVRRLHSKQYWHAVLNVLSYVMNIFSYIKYVETNSKYDLAKHLKNKLTELQLSMNSKQKLVSQ